MYLTDSIFREFSCLFDLVKGVRVGGVRVGGVRPVCVCRCVSIRG